MNDLSFYYRQTNKKPIPNVVLWPTKSPFQVRKGLTSFLNNKKLSRQPFPALDRVVMM